MILTKTLISTTALSILSVGFIYLILGYVFRQELANAFETPDQVNFWSFSYLFYLLMRFLPFLQQF